jgi:hypothetical protein
VKPRRVISLVILLAACASAPTREKRVTPVAGSERAMAMTSESLERNPTLAVMS